MFLKTTLALGVLFFSAVALADDDDQCQLWMAMSSTSTSSDPKFGLYAGIDFDQNDTVGELEIGIPMIDFTNEWNRKDKLSRATLDFVEGFMWTSEFVGAKWEGNFTTTVAIPGVGTLSNYHSGTYNVDWEQGAAILRDSPPEHTPEIAHPSRGAISPYHNLTLKATQPIKAGMEIFANFGDVWDGNKTDDLFQDKITRWDYIDADRVLDKVLTFMKKYDSSMTPQAKDEVLDFIMSKVLGTAAGTHAKVVRSLIPAHPGKLQAVQDMGGTFAYRNPDLIKTEKWLKKHGRCVSNLKIETSTVPEAGRGAFATRNIKAGEVIAPMPVMHIGHDQVLKMYDIESAKSFRGETLQYNTQSPRGNQLLLNYCLGHPESSLLLYPISPIVGQINHGPPGMLNAAIQWAKHPYVGNDKSFFDMEVSEIADYGHLGIVMDVIALKDIKKGDEVFIDYGPDWTKAWKDYFRQWSQAHNEDKSWPIRATDLRPQYADKPFKTLDELDDEPYPEGIYVACFAVWEEMTDGKTKVNENEDDIALWAGPKEYGDFVGAVMHACSVVSRTETLDDFLYNYTVYIPIGDGRVEVTGVPHYALTFVDEPYTSDIHTRGAFRHWIGIPDNIFPQKWRDRRG